MVAPIPEALEGEKGLWVRDIAKHHAISAPLATALDNTDSVRGATWRFGRGEFLVF